jgi:hypothetical protein
MGWDRRILVRHQCSRTLAGAEWVRAVPVGPGLAKWARRILGRKVDAEGRHSIDAAMGRRISDHKISDRVILNGVTPDRRISAHRILDRAKVHLAAGMTNKDRRLAILVVVHPIVRISIRGIPRVMIVGMANSRVVSVGRILVRRRRIAVDSTLALMRVAARRWRMIATTMARPPVVEARTSVATNQNVRQFAGAIQGRRRTMIDQMQPHEAAAHPPIAAAVPEAALVVRTIRMALRILRRPAAVEIVRRVRLKSRHDVLAPMRLRVVAAARNRRMTRMWRRPRDHGSKIKAPHQIDRLPTHAGAVVRRSRNKPLPITARPTRAGTATHPRISARMDRPRGPTGNNLLPPL